MTQEAERYSAFFSSIPIFKNLEPRVWDVLAQNTMQRSFWPGEKLTEQGSPCGELFIILEGECKVIVQHDEIGFARELYRLRSGDHFGETSLLAGQNAAASVVALSAGNALVLNGDVLHELLAASPELALALCAGMAQHLEEIARKDISLPFVSLDDYPGARQACKLLSEKASRACKALVLAVRDQNLVVGLTDPHNSKMRNFVRDELRQHTVEFVAIGEKDYERFAEAQFARTATPAKNADATSVTYIDPSGKEHELGDHQTAEVLEKVLLHAIHYGASDLHFEPAEPACRIRMRVDGNMLVLDKDVNSVLFTKLISRLKVISDLDITNRRLPQDGRFPIRMGSQRVEVRVSITPCQGGEKAVLRLLDQSRQNLDLQQLVLSDTACDVLRQVFRNSSGMVLVTGPTGAGKTTTLYAGLSEVWRVSQKVNIVTIEDPVEYQLHYATQIQVNRAVGLEFAQILRTALRQDPDVILVGEIRDAESASIAMESATTGHLVLSSLHTDSSLEAIVRLRKLDVKPYLMASALKCIISQRLVAKVCQHCKQPVPLTDLAVNALRQRGILPDGWQGELSSGKGCHHCRFEGDSGRVGIYEVLMINDALRELVEKDAPFAKLQEALSPENFISLASYSRYLLSHGLVSPEQVRSAFPRYAILGNTGN